MSYTEELKEALLSLPVKAPCCKRALLLGMLAVRAKSDADEISLSLDGEALVDFAVSLIRSQLGREATVKKNAYRASSFTLTFRSHAASEMLSQLNEKPLSEIQAKACENCKLMLLRGIFLASGRVTDPTKALHLEFSCGENRDAVAFFLSDGFDFPPKAAERRNEKLIYYKSNSAVSELLMLIGCSNAGFDVINRMIENEYRMEASRRANCETGNIAKAVKASMKQIEMIERLEAANKLSFLPPELMETAKFRLLHRDLSLTQLASAMTPPISKSGLNHRLTKIMELAKQFLA